jgi:hypothetical protein
MCVKLIFQALELFGYKVSETDYEKQVTIWEKTVKDNNLSWIKFVKYKIAAYYAFQLDQILPPAICKDDRPDKLIGGRGMMWLERFHHYNTYEKRLELLTTLKNGVKRAMPRPDKDALEKARVETYEILTTADLDIKPKLIANMSWNDTNQFHPRVELVNSRFTMEEQLNRTVDELFPKSRPLTSREREKEFFPSTSANYIRSRKNLGMVGALLDHPEILKGIRRRNGWLKVEEEIIKGKDESEERSEVPQKMLRVDQIEFDKAFYIMYYRCLQEAVKEEKNVALVALPEALKVRVISKGPPFTYFALRNIWKMIHSRLRKHPTFRLIGEPATAEVMREALGVELGEDEILFSGDYQSATDLLRSWASETVCRRLAENLNLFDIERELFLDSLTRHNIEDPKSNKKNLKFKKQQRGQLMGSITSFPILCIINATVCRWALEVSGNRPMSLKQTRMLINGDDIAAKAKKSFYQIWRDLITTVGLKESIGKTFVSQNFVELNSTNFLFTRDVEPKLEINQDGIEVMRKQPYTVVNYVNFGLIYGMKRASVSEGLSGREGSRRSEGTIGMRARELVKFAPPTMIKDVMRLFVENNRVALTTYKIPWYIPEWLGGFGLPGNEPSDLDLRMARHLLMNWADKHPTPIKAEGSWHIRELSSVYIPKECIRTVQTTEKPIGSESLETVYQLKGIDLLFDSRFDLDDLFFETRSDTAAIYRKNERLWTNIPKDLPKPLEKEKLEYQQKYDVIDLILNDTYIINRDEVKADKVSEIILD